MKDNNKEKHEDLLLKRSTTPWEEGMKTQFR